MMDTDTLVSAVHEMISAQIVLALSMLEQDGVEIAGAVVRYEENLEIFRKGINELQEAAAAGQAIANRHRKLKG